MKVRINDGGRSQYFKAKGVGDCVTRAVAIVTERNYKEVYKEITKLVGYTPRNGVRHKDTKTVMEHFGGKWIPTMTIGSGCHTHLEEGEIPMEKRIVCNLSRHVCAVIDGVINDTYDPSRNGRRCVYGYWDFGDTEGYTPIKVKKTRKKVAKKPYSTHKRNSTRNYEVALMQHVTGSVVNDYETVGYACEGGTYSECKKVAKELSKHYGAEEIKGYGKFSKRVPDPSFPQQPLDKGLAMVKIVCYTQDEACSYNCVYYEYYYNGKIVDKINFR